MTSVRSSADFVPLRVRQLKLNGGRCIADFESAENSR